MTGTAQLIYPSRANGSLIMKDGKIIGSELIGQKFDSCIYFWSRPSAIGYSPIPSGGSNLGPTSGSLKKLVDEQRLLFVKMNLISDKNGVPKEMIFASASGLDPHVSPEAALIQIDRISRARHLDNNQKQKVMECIKNLTEKPQLLILGEERINVLLLNLELNNIEENVSNFTD
jgi:K+-transporting ATPase ATPase C chain